MGGPTDGRTVLAHVEELLERAGATIGQVRARVGRRRAPISARERKTFGRELAGVVSACETVRIWLAAGARQ